MRHDPILAAGPAAADPVAVATALVAQRPDHVPARMLLWKELEQAGRIAEAEAAFAVATALVEGEAKGLSALGHLALRMGGFDEAERAFGAALALDPGDYPALLGMSALRDRMGDREGAAALRRAAGAATPVVDAPATGGLSMLRTRCLDSARYVVEETRSGYRTRFRGGHLPVAELIGEGRAVANLAGGQAALEACGEPALLLNAVACPDRGRRSLEAVARYAAAHPCVAVVNRAEAVLAARPDLLAARLGGLPGVRVARTRRHVREADVDALAAVVEAGLDYPFVVREAGEGGTALVEDRAGLTAWLEPLSTGAVFYAAAFEDARDACRVFRKARAFFVDGRLYPAALLGGPDWRVRARDRDQVMADGGALDDEERAFLADPASVIGVRRWGALRAACAATRLDHVGIDFAPIADGVLVLRIDPAMPLGRGRAGEAPHLDEVADAFRRMIVARRR